LNKEVEILKLGSIIPHVISKWESLEGKKEGKDTIMVVYNGGPIFDHYVSILKEFCGDEYKFLKTDKNIIGGPYSYRPGNNDPRLFGELDGELVIGMSFTVGNWHSSIVEKIINNNIVITKNSVYAIHSVSEFRDKKLKDLGI
jgi:hypothetical protein